MELSGILMKCGLFSVFSNTSSLGVGKNPHERLYWDIWLGRFLQMDMNNTNMCWLIGQVGIDGISLWSWMKVRYYIAAKLEPLCQLYRDKIKLLKLKVNGLLIIFLGRF